ncbi:MAG: Mu-like prophage major head subunit gpT family protein [Negativicutes bacterium]|nr:Mu-like prophage major head subunit gpT family protein [Negativicutes bacterium]
MIVNQAALAGIFRSFKVLFNQALDSATPQYTKISTIVPSTTREEVYKWLGRLPRMREWIGDRVIQNLSAYDYTIKNKDWEDTIEVDRNDIEDDAIGLYSPLFQMLGASAATHPDEIIFSLLASGFTSTCYDGQYFFDTDHKDGDNPIQSNKGTLVLTPASYGAARAQMMSLLDDQGKPLAIVPNLLVVPPQLEGMGRKILLAETVDATTNTYKGSADLLVAPYLAANPTAWFLLDVSRPIKPLVFQWRKKPEFIAKDHPNDDNVFMKKKFLYGADCRDNAGFGLWQLGYGSTGTTT